MLRHAFQVSEDRKHDRTNKGFGLIYLVDGGALWCFSIEVVIRHRGNVEDEKGEKLNFMRRPARRRKFYHHCQLDKYSKMT